MTFLAEVYKKLDYSSGDLLSAVGDPGSNQSDWLEKGEWLAAAKTAGAEKVYFINNNPVAIFAECAEGLKNKIQAFNRLWCLARPRILFLSSPGELTVYDLAQKPIDENNEEEYQNLRSLAVVSEIASVSEQLRLFHRDHLDSGSLFADSRFGDLNNRADKALIRDLKMVRRDLIEAGLNMELAHALIGRSIFIRYLEDRGVLNKRYFRSVARKKKGWTDFLDPSQSRVGFVFSDRDIFYPKVLANKKFTYELFKQLANDFNGDMFTDSDLKKEEATVKQSHLNLIQDLLYGDAGKQKKLFFLSYDFNIVPLDLISSIYEEFYHSTTSSIEKKSKARQDGAYYTPSVLAEFVVSRVLTNKVLRGNPRVLDPACGSGIFLVEAFRRIVRYKWYKKGKSLTFDEMRTILKDQIAGIEVNPEAAKIASFSLYLALLNYLDPPAITKIKDKQTKLPHLIVSNRRGQNYFHSILPYSAFDQVKINSNSLWKERFGENCADVVVGNPPWGKPGGKADEKTKNRHKEILEWCKIHEKPIGDKEPCQAFLWRTLDFLRKDGAAAMLAPAGMLFKQSSTSKDFREQWMSNICLNEVYNFIHVRNVFFTDAVSPFVLVNFSNKIQSNTIPIYWSVKQIISVKETQSILLNVQDKIFLRNVDLEKTATWKSSWFGSYGDSTFLHYLVLFSQLGQLIDRENSGRGYQTYTTKHVWSKLETKKTIKKILSRYDKLTYSSNPSGVYNVGPKESYSGNRLLINEGIFEKCQPKGQLLARYETEKFSFSRSVYGIKLKKDNINQYKLLIGILWSSFARYYFFNTTAYWGLWNHKILLDEELLRLPVVIDLDHSASKRIIKIVDKLRNYQPEEQTLLNRKGNTSAQIRSQRLIWEKQLDEAVFDIYDFSEEQRDLIRDCCEVTLPFFYKPFKSLGTEKAIDNEDNTAWMEQYARIYANRWKPYLGKNEEMRAELHIGAHGNMVAVEFFPANASDSWDLSPRKGWEYLLEQISKSLPRAMGSSQIVLDGLVHVITDDSIIIIKRNTKRLWTRSLAREDADSTIAKRMIKTKQGGKM
ncbi:class I SAM-dependent DNA methyltransferase [Planctomycetota bacterium]